MAIAGAARVLVVDCVALVGGRLLGNRLCLVIFIVAATAICLA